MVSMEEQAPPIEPKDVWSELPKDNLTKKEIVERIKDDLTPVSPEKYLSFKSTNLPRLEQINTEQLEAEMPDHCICSIVVPAHNENTLSTEMQETGDTHTNIIKFLEAMNAQSFSEESNLEPNNFEVVIVDNNSTDGTAEAARKWIQENNPTIPIRIISIDFSDEEKGVGSARKLGADLSILRAIRRESELGEHYIVGLDSDNHKVPVDHFEKIIRTFRNTNALALAGESKTSKDVYDLLLGGIEDGREEFIEAALAFREFMDNFIIEQSKIKNEFFSLDTFGPNHAIKTDVFMQIRGYPPGWKTGEDVYLGWALERGIGYLPSDIEINPRRALANPIDFYTGVAHREDRFSADDEKIRSGIKSQDLSLEPEFIKKRAIKVADQFASNFLADGKKISWHDAVVETRKVFNNLCDRYAVPENLRLSKNIFFVETRTLEKSVSEGRIVTTNEGKSQDIEEFESFILTEDHYIKRAQDSNQDDGRLIFIKTDPKGIPLL